LERTNKKGKKVAERNSERRHAIFVGRTDGPTNPENPDERSEFHTRDENNNYVLQSGVLFFLLVLATGWKNIGFLPRRLYFPATRYIYSFLAM
jgi:hypothetical protein